MVFGVKKDETRAVSQITTDTPAVHK